MKVLVELLVIGLLVTAGWHQPFRSHYERISGQPPATPRPAAKSRASLPAMAPRATATPVPDRSWLWGPTKLDPKKR